MRCTFVPASTLALLVFLPVGRADAGTPFADLRVTMTDGVLRAAPGGALTYDISVFNAGPDAAPGSSVSTSFPPFITPGSWTCSGFSGGVCTTPSGSGAINTVVDLPAGGLVVFSASATVAGGATGLITAFAGASPPSGVTDPSPETNVAADTDNVTLEISQLAHGYDDLRALDAPGAQDYFWISQEPFASYEVVVDATSGDIGGAEGPQLERLASNGTQTLQTALPVGTGPSRSLRWRTQSGPFRIDDQFIRVRSGDCSPCGADDVYRIRAYETTYSITRYNNGGSQTSVLFLQNTTTDTVAGTIYFWVASGGAIATFGFNLPARQGMVLNTATVAPGQGGALTISNDGRYGALVGKTVALEAATGFSFDTPLLPRPR